MNLPRLFSVLFAGAACFTTACGSDSPIGPTPRAAPFDVAAVLAEIARATPDGVRGEMGVSGMNPITPVAPSTCTYVAASQSFICPTQTFGSKTITFSYMLLDAAGHPQSAPSVATTAAVRTVSTVKGPLGTPTPVTTNLDFERTDDMTLSGLLTGVHTLNGTANGTSVFESDASEPTIFWTTADRSTSTNIVLPKSGSTSPWPVSGTLTTDQTVTLDHESPSGTKRAIHTVMTFNGSANVTVTVTLNGVTATCTIDLQGPGPFNIGGSACLPEG